MTIDRARLDALRSFEDAQLGIRERFLTPHIGGAATIAVLSVPLHGRATSGWVIAPSFAFEQTNLMTLEVALARVPWRIEVLAALPRTSTGKPDRVRLTALAAAAVSATGAEGAPGVAKGNGRA